MKKYVLFALLCFLVLPLLAVNAQEDTTVAPEETFTPEETQPQDEQAVPESTTPSPQEQCFEMLKEDMADTGIFEEPLQELQAMGYGNLKSQFSRTYKGLMSFGDFVIDQNDVETKVYSFGEQTGYIHPPLNPYPVSLNTEMWDEPAKQYIVVEEYIVEPVVGTHFIDCGFIEIAAEDLMEVTRENYLYDGQTVSLIKKAKDSSYKSWYSQFDSFNLEDKPFVTWKRLFVYPKATQNDYFNKYDVADAKLAHMVDSYDVLEFYREDVVMINDYDQKGALTVKAFSIDENGDVGAEVTVPEELTPLKREGVNTLYSKAKYYEAIEARFPEFYELLSFRGSLDYDMYKRMLLSKDELTEAEKEILNSMYDYRTMTKRYIEKMLIEKQGVMVDDPDFEKFVAIVGDADEALEKTDGTIAQQDSAVTTDIPEEEDSNTLLYLLIGLLGCILVVAIAILAMRKKEPTNITVE